MSQKTELKASDILSMEEYEPLRAESRKRVSALKKNRRIGIGPDATFYFESFETMRHQVQEMLWIEKGGEGQIEGELAAYSPLVPNGRELVATVMIEIDDPERRAATLAALGGFEETIFIAFDGVKTVSAIAEDDLDRTTANGKASSVQFIHFPFGDAEIASFRDSNVQISIGIDHPKYGHIAIVGEDVRGALASDFDL